MLDYGKFKNTQVPVPTVAELEIGLLGKKGSGEGRVFAVFIGLMFLFGILLFFNYNTIYSLIPVQPIFIIGTYIALAVVISGTLASLTDRNLGARARAKTINQGQNDKFALNKVWRISTGGIRENLEIKTSSYNGNTLSIKYDNDTILIKFLMDNVLDAEPDADIRHFLGYTKIMDLIMKNNYDVEIISLRYNPELDPIWNNSSHKIAKASQELGSNFTLTRSLLENRLYDFTRNYSTVDVQYLLIKSTPTRLKSPTEMLNIILAHIKNTRLRVEGVDTQEFKQFVEQYYNTEISFEDITEYVSSTNLPFETKVLCYKLSNSVITINEPYKYTIPTTLFNEPLSNKNNKSKTKSKVNKTKIENELEELSNSRDRTFNEW